MGGRFRFAGSDQEKCCRQHERNRRRRLVHAGSLGGRAELRYKQETPRKGLGWRTYTKQSQVSFLQKMQSMGQKSEHVEQQKRMGELDFNGRRQAFDSTFEPRTTLPESRDVGLMG